MAVHITVGELTDFLNRIHDSTVVLLNEDDMATMRASRRRKCIDLTEIVDGLRDAKAASLSKR
jgi:hypothetical protein